MDMELVIELARQANQELNALQEGYTFIQWMRLRNGRRADMEPRWFAEWMWEHNTIRAYKLAGGGRGWA